MSTIAFDKNLSFCKFRIPEKGGRVIWEITNECNYACKYCIFASTGRIPPGELDTLQAYSVLQQLKECGFNSLKFTGGEPFLRSDMLNILQHATSLGFICDISTNASKIDEYMAKQLSLLNLEMVHVSLDGHTQEIHEAVRGKKSFLPTLRGLQLLLQHNIKLRIGCVIHAANEHYLQEMVAFCASLGVHEVIFSMMEPAGRLRGKSSGLASMSPQQLKNILDDLSLQYSLKVSHNLDSNIASKSGCGVCPGGKKFLFINSTGIVSPCTWVSEKRPDMIAGNIKDTSLSILLQSASINKLQAISHHFSQSIAVCPMEVIEQTNEIDKIMSSIENANTSSKFSHVSSLYSFSTENLEYMKYINFTNKDVLTVGGSYDQAINAYALGAKSVHNIDMNYRAQFYGELKHIALKHLSYSEYLKFFMRSQYALQYDVYTSLKPYLSSQTALFFDTAYKVLGNTIRESYLFNNINDNMQDKINNSSYLINEHAFNHAKEKLQHFVWHTQSVDNIIDTSYDIILLSNIADYSHTMFPNDHQHTEKFKQYIVLPWLEKLKPHGCIMFGYVFDAHNIFHSDKRNEFNNEKIRQNLYENIPGYDLKEIVVSSAIKDALHDTACVLIKKGQYE